jgi:hypothetical protein
MWNVHRCASLRTASANCTNTVRRLCTSRCFRSLRIRTDRWPPHAWLAPFLIALGLIIAGTCDVAQVLIGRLTRLAFVAGSLFALGHWKLTEFEKRDAAARAN